LGQIFSRRTNYLADYSIFAVLGSVPLLIGVSYALNSSPYVTGQDVARGQEVPFSHRHHVSGIGLDCRYCHTSVETAAFAGIPPTHTCMTCHSQIWTEAPILEPVRASYRDDEPLQWVRVHDLPDFVYFNHSIHLAKGVGCSTCHGDVADMPLVRQHASLTMGWCVDCHRDPVMNIRPKDELFNTRWQAPPDQRQRGAELMAQYGVAPRMDCYACHR
jgi:hypothetical protein